MAPARRHLASRRHRNLAAGNLGLTPSEAAAWAAPKIRAGAEAAGRGATAAGRAAAPHIRAAAKEAVALARRGAAAASPHVRAGISRVPRKVWIGLGVLAVGGLGWFLYDNRDRNPMGTKAEFTRKLWQATDGFGLSVNARKLIIAQFALESGWGYARAAVKGYNYGNITAGANWNGPITFAEDKHCIMGGAICIPIIQRFRKYDSDVEAIKDYLAFMSAGRYGPSMAALKGGNLVEFATQLRTDGYYTASVDVYVNGMRGATGAINVVLGTGPLVA